MPTGGASFTVKVLAGRLGRRTRLADPLGRPEKSFGKVDLSLARKSGYRGTGSNVNCCCNLAISRAEDQPEAGGAVSGSETLVTPHTWNSSGAARGVRPPAQRGSGRVHAIMGLPMRWMFWGLAVAAVAVVGCRSDAAPAAGERSAAALPTQPLPVLDRRALFEAEQRRRSAAFSAADLSTRQVVHRRLAARALSRIADRGATELLLQSLADDDGEVVAWSAYGLGYGCRGNEVRNVDALVARLVSWTAAREASPERTERFGLDPVGALVDAIARCGTPPAEQTLATLLQRSPPEARRAALGLGRVASARGILDGGSVVALIDATERKEPVDAALAALARLDYVDAGVRAPLLEAVKRALGRGAESRVFAIEAAKLAGPAAAGVLEQVVVDPRAPVAERSLAASELADLGVEGQAALRSALTTLVANSTRTDESALLGGHFGAVLSVLQGLRLPVHGLGEVLGALAERAIPEDASDAVRRRMVQIRCSAAALLAGTASLSARLVQCDPDPNPIVGDLAVLSVLDRGVLEGPRWRRYVPLATDAPPAVRMKALSMLATHPEAVGAAPLIAKALADERSGVVAAAAGLLARHPALGTAERRDDDSARRAPAPTPGVLKALGGALEREWPVDQIAVRSALVAAASTLQVLSAKPLIEAYCKDPNPTLRGAAERALRRLGSPNARCEQGSKSGSVVVPPQTFEKGPVTLTFVTDVGRYGITLDPELAPAAVTRIVSLAERGFYDGLTLDRRSGGTIVQFGDPQGDGYGGAGLAPLPCETSPVDFQAYRVGVALSGRDTGSSQIFVTLVPKPSLDGDYAIIGWADPEWALLADGDRIRKVDVKR